MRERESEREREREREITNLAKNFFFQRGHLNGEIKVACSEKKKNFRLNLFASLKLEST